MMILRMMRCRVMMLSMMRWKRWGGGWWCQPEGRGQTPRCTLCASLRSQNALQHVTRATLYILYRNLQEKGCAPGWAQNIPERAHTFCASIRSRNALQHFTRATLYGNFQEKCRAPKPRRRLCASLRSRNACQDFTRATLCGNLKEKGRAPEWAQNAAAHFVRWSSTGLYS